MDYFDFESAMRRADQPPVNSANHHPGLPSEELETSSNPQAPPQYGTNYPWMPENYVPLGEPLGGGRQWDSSLEATSSPYFQNPMDMSAFSSPGMQTYQGQYLDSPVVTPGISHGHSMSAGPASPYPDQSANAAMTANSQEMQNWFAQSARRDSRSRKGFPRRRSLYSRSSGVPISIPKQQHTDWSALDPLQRWQNSPPENEPASISDIHHAVASTDLDQHLRVGSTSSSRVSTPGIETRGFGYAARRTSRPASISSLESGTSNGSMDSILSGRSANSRLSTGSDNRKKSRSNTRVTKSRARPGPSNDDRPFQCTFCCDTFKNKFDWCRHEKSLHLNPEQWVCTPEGETVTCPTTGNMLCAYCLIPQPSTEHLEVHNPSACAHKNLESRSFKRKDHLIQHLRLVHKIENIPTIGEWKPPELCIKSRCGFCNAEMESWKARADHLSKHFREGKKMVEWRGTHGFEPHVAQQVTNSMPPFLIGGEAKTPVPFSATKSGHSELLAQITSRAALSDAANNNIVADPSPSPENAQGEGNQPFKTAWELLTWHLGRYAQEQMKAGVVPTDEMFQQESRRLWFDSDDPWNQTFADDTQWMEIFRQEHGLHDGNTPEAS
ncbi:hypothetical protein D6D02_04246 [Aureobasidium pullulans]|nr:hypothetical protein D6D02_04246 [Aureobasidium pullulans]